LLQNGVPGTGRLRPQVGKRAVRILMSIHEMKMVRQRRGTACADESRQTCREEDRRKRSVVMSVLARPVRQSSADICHRS
jgi:hypothetical protein